MVHGICKDEHMMRATLCFMTTFTILRWGKREKVHVLAARMGIKRALCDI